MAVDTLIAREVLSIDAPAEVVREFIQTPARIGDYDPGVKDHGVIDPWRVDESRRYWVK